MRRLLWAHFAPDLACAAEVAELIGSGRRASHEASSVGAKVNLCVPNS